MNNFSPIIILSLFSRSLSSRAVLRILLRSFLVRYRGRGASGLSPPSGLIAIGCCTYLHYAVFVVNRSKIKVTSNCKQYICVKYATVVKLIGLNSIAYIHAGMHSYLYDLALMRASAWKSSLSAAARDRRRLSLKSFGR